jgi:hypothetical protein
VRIMKSANLETSDKSSYIYTFAEAVNNATDRSGIKERHRSVQYALEKLFEKLKKMRNV